MANPKLLPQAINLEEAVLGALLVSGSTIDECMPVLKTEDVFYKEQNRYVFLAIKSIYEENGKVDIVTVSQKLKSLGLLDKSGGDLYLINLTQKIASGAHAEYHSRILLQKMTARKIIEFNSRVTALAYDESTDVFELLAKWSAEFDKINEFILSGRTTMNFPTALQELRKRVELLSSQTSENHLFGIHTGFERINRFTGGYKSGNLIVVGARPGMGKTSYALRIALENIKQNIPVGIISLEMDIVELTARFVALDSNFHLSQIVKKGFEKEAYFRSFLEDTYKMEKYPVYIDDSAKSDVVDVVSQARLWHRMFGIKILIVDYLQLMTDKTKKNSVEEVTSISRKMKLLAKELEIPVVLLSQLSRKVEDRPNKRPKLSDLRESGAIEQDADIVQFIYRPGYYGVDVSDDKMLQEGTDSEIIFAKYRGGSVGIIPLKWIGDKTKFADPIAPSDKKYFSFTYSVENDSDSDIAF